MAQGFDVTQSLFGNVLTPEQQATSAAMQQAQLGGLGGAEFQAFRAQESARQQIPKIFGQQSEDDIVKDVRNKNLPILQSKGKLAYLDAIIADFSTRGLGNKAFLAQQLKDQIAEAEQKKQADLELTAAKTAQARAAAEKSGQEKISKIGVSSDGKAVYRVGTEEFTLVNGQPVRFSGSLRKEAGDINVGGEDVFKAINQVNTATKQLDTQVSALDDALALLNKSDSPFAQAAFGQQVASVFGDSQKAASEIKALINTGNLGQRIENTFTKFLTGEIGKVTKDDQREALLALRQEIGKRFNNVTKGYRAAAEKDPKYRESASQIAPKFEEKYGNPPEAKEIISVPPSVVAEKGWKDGAKVKRGNKKYTFSAAKNQLIED
jgi:hypothetical protein